MISAATKHSLYTLARLYNVQPTYYDISGRFTEPPLDAVLRILKMLGAPIERLEDLEDALRQRRRSILQRGIEPVVLAWDGAAPALRLRLPHGFAETAPHYHVSLENGGTLEGTCRDDARFKPVCRRLENESYVARRLIVPELLPMGYHRLKLEVGGRSLEAFLFSAPMAAFTADPNPRGWGLFCPLFALHSSQSWGIGSFSELQGLAELTAQFGGRVVATLPMLAAFLDEPFNPSPYAPVSRLFWNELYLDLPRIPELETSTAAKALVNSADFQAELQSLCAAPWVEYRRAMALKRRVLEELARSIFGQPSQRRARLERFIDTHPRVEDYAAFRAQTERERKTWEHWPPGAREGNLDPGGYSQAVQQYHLYVQWQAHEQIHALAAKAKAGGPALYLDFPLGVNRDGYDAWRERRVFVLEANGGAPPDNFFSKGQDWGFPPLHPHHLRDQGYIYYIECLRHHLACAGMLRIDHVMGLHRLYWVPRGFAPTEGVYVRYPAEEFYAILNIESHRHRAEIVGENLGTVPPYIHEAMEKHKIRGMFVGQFGIGSDPHNCLANIAAGSVASLNTHDTPTFAGFWQERDIHDRVDLGLLTAEESERERRWRAAERAALIAHLKARGWLHGDSPDLAAVLRGCLLDMAARAAVLLVNLEDLWLEPLPQNVPGTWEERPNWQRKAKFSLEAIAALPAVTDALKAIDAVRRERR